MAVSDTEAAVFHSQGKKEKTKKPRKDDSEDTPSNLSSETIPIKASKNKSPKVIVNVEVDALSQPVVQKEKKTKKRKREVATDEGSPENTGKKGKKISKRAKAADPEDSIATSQDAPTKKRKNKTGFLDPNDDATLLGQSQKCLAYAFLQFHRPSKWKFNKARQNWLIRNIWSSETVPEAHFPLALAYITKVQGGIRENLLKLCHAALEPPKIAEPPQAEEAPNVDTAPSESTQPTTAKPAALSEADNIKKARAHALIDLFSARPDPS